MDKLQEVIPNFFYDLISRVIPGSILLVFMLCDQRFQPLLSNQLSEIILVIAFLFGSYVVGFCMDNISTIIFFYIRPFLYRIYNRLNRNKIRDISVTKVAWKARDMGKEDIYLSLKKHSAEEGLFKTLLLEWLLICLFDFYLAGLLSWIQKAFIFGLILFSYFYRLIATKRLAQKALEVYGEGQND